MSDFVDLTLDSDDEAPPFRPAKRPRGPSPGDSDDVIIVEEEDVKRQKAAQPHSTLETLDDDIVVTAETGQTALRDFAHARPDCGYNAFKKEASADNSKQCSHCYCFVCDSKASECKFWGTGVRARDHCNAHTSSYWDALRKAARKGNKALLQQEHISTSSQLSPHWLTNSQPASRSSSAGRLVSPAELWARRATAAVASSQALLNGGAGTTAAAAAALAGSHLGPAGAAAAPPKMPSSHFKAEAKAPAAAAAEPARPLASTWLLTMPHPREAEPGMQLLATLELPVKLVKGLTIAEVQRRLVSTGFYKGATGKTPEYGEHLCLDNISNSRYVPGKRKEKVEFLTLLPMVPPGGLPQQPSRKRTWRLVVVPHDASARPIAVAVTVEHECKLSVLASTLKQQLGPGGLKAFEDLVLAAYQATTDSWRWLRDSDMRMTDDQLTSSSNSFTHYAFKCPKDLLPKERSGSMNYSRADTKMALVMHEKMVPAERPSGHDDSDDEGMDDYMRLVMGIDTRSGAARSKLERFGQPQLVVLPSQHLKGGESADNAVKKSVISQLNLYCQPNQLPSHNSWSFELHRHSARDSWRIAEEGNRFASRVNVDLGCSWESPGIATLYAHWGTEPLAPPPGFDLEAFSAVPEVDDAADRQRLADMNKALQEWQDYQAEMRMLNQLPGQVLAELRQACTASPPPASPQAVSVNAHKPAAATVLTIVPARGTRGAASSSSAAASSSVAECVAAAAAAARSSSSSKKKEYSSDRLGVLRVEVYVYRHAGRNHRLVAEDYNDWAVEETGGRGRNRHHYHSANQLKNVMNARLLQEPSGYALLREINQLAREGETTRGIAKLMQWLVTGERTPAQQPPGLTVQMHPYQLQSLAFMIESEQLDGGWRQLLWRWLPPAPGQGQQQPKQELQQQQQQPKQELQQQQQQLGGDAGAGPSSSAALQPVRGRGVWWSPVLERLSFNVPAAPWGGFLAEEMGLGKTVEVLGLVLSNPAAPSVISGSIDAASGKVMSRATLVVCAVSLVGQWCQEASKKLAGSLKMYPYHGSSRIRDPQRLAKEFDLVVTTYATLASDYGKNGDGTRTPVHKIKWHRVVFDEGHTVKNVQAAHSKACVNIAADRRWCCTGTPLNNDITDLLGQFAALQMQPMATKTFFDSRIKPAFTSHGYGVSLVPLLYTLRHTLIRHTKAQTISGQSVLALPDKTEEMVPVVLSARERQTYLDVHAKAAALWASVRHFPPAAINQRLLQIMALLLPLRRICSGGQLRPSDLALPARLEAAVEVAEAAGHGMHHGLGPAAAAGLGGAGAAGLGAGLNVPEDNTLRVPEALECPICLDAFETPVMTPCHHWFCKECILGVLSGNTHCPLCRGNVDAVGLRAPGKNNVATPVVNRKRRKSADDSGDDSDSDSIDLASTSDSEQPDGTGAAAAEQVVECESKLQALLAELTAMRQADSSSKALVFSQYNSTLEWLKRRLPEEGFGFRTITGSMAQRQRAKAIEAFQSDPPTTVFLLSMRSGAVGINLTAASHVFLLEPCLNPALEEQAIGRAWRMGQTRKVVVKRFYVKGSIEERIMDVRRIRQGHAQPAAAAGAGGEAGSSAAAAAAAAAAEEDAVPRTGKGRKLVGATAMAGSLKADRQVLKIAELDLLFRTPELDSGSAGAGSSAAAAAAAAAAGAARS